MHLADYKLQKDGPEVQATQRVLFHSLPRLLIMHLSRFAFNLATGNGKVHKRVHFDAELRQALHQLLRNARTRTPLESSRVYSGIGSLGRETCLSTEEGRQVLSSKGVEDHEAEGSSNDWSICRMKASWLARECPQRRAAPVYELIAVVTHLGVNAQSGHYTAAAKQPNGSWLAFDDATVTVCPLTKVLEEPAYLLFYRLK